MNALLPPPLILLLLSLGSTEAIVADWVVGNNMLQR